MLTEIAAEALHFLSRRDLDNASGVGKWLDALISQCCEVYPLRPVLVVGSFRYATDSPLDVFIREEEDGELRTEHSSNSVDEALHFVGSLLRHSYVEALELNFVGLTVISPNSWTTLMDATRLGAVGRLTFGWADFSTLGNDTFIDVVRCHGLHTLTINAGGFPPGFVADDLIRSSATQFLHQLCVFENRFDGPHRFSDGAIQDFFFREDAVPAAQSLSLEIEGIGLTDMFLINFFERLQSSPFQHSGEMKISGAAKQRRLSAFARYLAEGEVDWAAATYRFPLSDDGGNKSHYEVNLRQSTSYMRMKFSPPAADNPPAVFLSPCVTSPYVICEDFNYVLEAIQNSFSA